MAHLAEVTRDTHWIVITAHGGNRRARAAVIARTKRDHPEIAGVAPVMTYSETYGFQTASYARYRRTDS